MPCPPGRGTFCAYPVQAAVDAPFPHFLSTEHDIMPKMLIPAVLTLITLAVEDLATDKRADALFDILDQTVP